MELTIGDKVLFRKKDDKLYSGLIKSIHEDNIEIDDTTIELVIAAISKGTIADNLVFDSSKYVSKYTKVKHD